MDAPTIHPFRRARCRQADRSGSTGPTSRYPACYNSQEINMAEQRDDSKPAEIESLNDNILEPDEATLENLEQVSGGAEEAECGTFQVSCGIDL